MKTRRYAEPAPTSYEELWSNYFQPADGEEISRAERATRKFLPAMDDAEREDLVQSVFERCLRAKVVENYNPERAGFGTLFFCVARSVCSNWVKHNTNKALVGRRTLTPETDDLIPPVILRMRGPQRRDVEEIDAKSIMAEVMELAKQMQQRGRNERDLKLFDLLVAIGEGLSIRAAAIEVGVGRQSAYNWVTKFLPKQFPGLKAEKS